MFRTCININQRPWDWERVLLSRVHYSKAGTEFGSFLTTTACSLRALTFSCVITPKHLCASPRGSDSQSYSSFKHHQHLTYRSKPKPNQQSHAKCSSRGFISFYRKSAKRRKNSTCFRFKYSLVFTKISTTLHLNKQPTYTGPWILSIPHFMRHSKAVLLLKKGFPS